MAEIRVERKRGPKVWVWIVLFLLIVAAVAAWYFLTQTRTVAPASPGASANRRAPAVVRADHDSYTARTPAMLAGIGVSRRG